MNVISWEKHQKPSHSSLFRRKCTKNGQTRMRCKRKCSINNNLCPFLSLYFLFSHIFGLKLNLKIIFRLGNFCSFPLLSSYRSSMEQKYFFSLSLIRSKHQSRIWQIHIPPYLTYLKVHTRITTMGFRKKKWFIHIHNMCMCYQSKKNVWDIIISIFSSIITRSMCKSQ